MTPLIVQDLVRRIHATSARIVLVANGGISGLATLLEEVFPPRALLEVIVPQTPAAMRELLGSPCEKMSGEQTARALAMAAFLKSQRYVAAASDAATVDDSPVIIGAACVAVPRTGEGRHSRAKLHVAIQAVDYTRCASLEMNGGARSFHEEDYVAGRLLMNELANSCGLEGNIPLGLMVSESVEWRIFPAEKAWREVFLGETKLALGRGKQAADASPPRPGAVIFPGAFNPLHAGHQQMASIAQQRTGQPVEFEIAIRNVDKLPLDYVDISQRLAQFQADLTVWLTRAARFTEKADLFPGATFVVGIDTIRRFASAQYYAGYEAAGRAAIEQVAARGCRFLVFGRSTDGGFETLSQLNLSTELRQLCDEVSEAEFRSDVSSTVLRDNA